MDVRIRPEADMRKDSFITMSCIYWLKESTVGGSRSDGYT